MEIGSFIELQFNTGNEWYSENKFGLNNIARLNTGRAAIYHAIKTTGCSTVWLPYYQCDSVREFLARKQICIKYYHIDDSFNPIDIVQDKNEAVLFVNYYGMFSENRMRSVAKQYQNVIIDNSQAFFAKPLSDCYNVYSCRKFIGVSDGSYVIGNNAKQNIDSYEQAFSSDTSLFLLQRIEYGCEGKGYKSRSVNEERINSEDVLRMSKLTHTILDGTNYDIVYNKRRQNFQIAHQLLGSLNKINPMQWFDDTVAPMVYPLVIEDDDLLFKLQSKKHFQGHWWEYLVTEMPKNSFEYWLSRYVIPITIDQRYGEKELLYLEQIIKGN